MKKLQGIIWGIVLVAVGVIYTLNVFEITNINVFFDGWWTLFIIIPCTVGLFSEKDKFGNIIGILVGVVLLLCCQEVLTFELLWKLIVPALIIIFGIRMILRNIFGNKAEKEQKIENKNNINYKNATAVFSGQDCIYNGEVFDGGEYNALFGGIKCDLRNAVIPKDCVINATAIFGGIDIFLPPNVNIQIKSNSIFGGISNKTHRINQNNFITVYVKGTCLFGGVDIK